MLSALCLAALLAPQFELPAGKMAILEPIPARSLINQEGPRTDPFEAATRVINRMDRESRNWPDWQTIDILPAEDTKRAQLREIGPRGTLYTETALRRVAQRLRARYVVLVRLNELTGARTSGLSARTTGRANLEICVYDYGTKAFVWADDRVETSTITGTRFALEPRMDQALLNALRRSLEPWLKEGKPKEDVPSESWLKGD